MAIIGTLQIPGLNNKTSFRIICQTMFYIFSVLANVETRRGKKRLIVAVSNCVFLARKEINTATIFFNQVFVDIFCWS